jgi:cyclopropane-fatty-acyl-phospholipid synthase
MRVQPSTRSDDAAKTAVTKLHARIKRVSGVDLPLQLWDGSQVGPSDAAFRFVLSDDRSLRAALWPPSDLSAGEAYLDGWLDIAGDAVAAMAVGERLFAALPRSWWARVPLALDVLRLPAPPRRRQERRASLTGRLHSPERDRRAIAFHYDLPHSFYASFLDPRLVYSCAYFAPGDDDLERAQLRKLDLVCRKLLLQPGQRLLDIGCGWGSLLIYAAERYGVDATGVTLSQTQAEAGNKMIHERGLGDRARILLRDYRDVEGRFDAVGSIGMAEHVGPDNLVSYGTVTRELLKPGGLFLCHSIVTGDAAHVRQGDEKTFTSAYVFPDGGLVPDWRLLRSLREAGLELVDVEQLQLHYALTLRQWVDNLEANHERAVDAAGERAYRIWRAYMAASSHSFASGSLAVIQVLVRAPGGDEPLPRGREWMLTDQ